MTLNLDEFYGVSVIHAEKIGPRKWRGKGDIFRRDTQENIKTVFAEGGAMTSADSNVIKEARLAVAFLGAPENWQGK